MLWFEEKKYEGFYQEPKTKKDTVVVDIGTYEIKAGYLNELCIVVKNQIYRNKRKAEFEAFPSSQRHTMFEDDCIVNFDVFGAILNKIISYLDANDAKNLIITTTPCSPSNEALLEYISANFQFKNVTFGLDFMYSYNNAFRKINDKNSKFQK